MEVKWLIETDVFEDNTDKLIETIKSKGMEVHVVPYIPFSNELVEKCYEIYDSEQCVVFYGSLNFGKKLKNAWTPGVYLNEKAFECTSYYPYLKDLLLHYKSYIMMPYGDLLLRKDFIFDIMAGFVDSIYDGTQIFIRPNSGTKEFTGFVTTFEDFEKDVELAGFYDVTPDLLVMVSPAEKLSKEWRFVIVDGKVVSGSLYRDWTVGADNVGAVDFVRRKSKSVHELCIDLNAWKMAQYGADRYNPDKAWTIDVCKTSTDEYKILEIGCFSCAGMYANDLDVVVGAVSNIALKEWEEYNEFS